MPSSSKQRFATALLLVVFSPLQASAQFMPRRDPTLDRLSACLLRTRPAGVDLAVMNPTFTRLGGAPEQFQINGAIMNWGRTTSPVDITVNITGGEDLGDQRILRSIVLPSLSPCRSTPVSYTFTVSECTPGSDICLRNIIRARYNLFRIALPLAFSDAIAGNNVFEISGADMATRFGIP
jgi:hypothetical protein